MAVPAAGAVVRIKSATGTCPVPRAAAAEVQWVMVAAVDTTEPVPARAAAAVPPVWVRVEAAVVAGDREE
jgi:hypothetical protein